MNTKKIYLLLLTICLAGCGVVDTTSRISLEDGYYFKKLDGQRQQVYVDIEEETINIYPVEEPGEKEKALAPPLSLPREITGEITTIAPLYEYTFDLDFITIPLKYRPGQQNVPAQLNTELNGSIFAGYRMDRYRLKYETTPNGKSHMESTHLGFSIGAFTGLGNTAVTPTTTFNQVDLEYDGIIWLYGIAGTLGFNDITLGLAVGFDSLLDSNRDFWIYQSKPWVGFTFGVNLN